MSMPKLSISRSTCSFGSCMDDDDDLVIITEQIVSADPAIQRCLFICGMVYRFAGSRTNILRIKLSQSITKNETIFFLYFNKIKHSEFLNKIINFKKYLYS